MSATPAINQGWYDVKIDQVPESTLQILYKYSGIDDFELMPHLERIRSEAFRVFPYPCIGQLRFLNSSLSNRDDYPEILSRLKAGQRLMDLGCCMGTDIRKLVFDGAPPTSVFGVELHEAYITKGFELYRDSSTIPRTAFCVADMTLPSLGEDLTRLEGTIDIFHAASFFHLLDVNQQVDALRNIVRLMRKQPGSVIIGRHIGSLKPGLFSQGLTSQRSMSYIHNAASLDALMRLIGAETGTVWRVDSTMDDGEFIPVNYDINTVKNTHPWFSPGMKRQVFKVELTSFQ